MMPPLEFGIWVSLLMLACVVSAALSAWETILLSMREHRLRTLAERRPDLEAVLRDLAERSKEYLTQTLLISSAVNLFAALTAVYLVHESGWFAFDRSYWWLELIIIVSLMVVLLDSLPRRLAARSPGRVCAVLGRPFQRLMRGTLWLSRPLSARIEKLTRRMIPAHIQPRTQLMQDELTTMVDIREERGAVSELEGQMIREVIMLDEKTVSDCMTTRSETLTIPRTQSPHDLRAALRETFHHWIPVYEEGAPEQITAMLDAKAFLAAGDEVSAIAGFLSTPVILTETMPALEALDRHLRRPHSLAIVMNEFGEYEGVVGHKDIFEDLLEDELPIPDAEEPVKDSPDGRLDVRGDARLEDVSEWLGMPLEREGLDTIGGLVFGELGYLPEQGAEVTCAGLSITIAEIQGARIQRLLIERPGND